MITRSTSAKDVPVVAGRSTALALPPDFLSLSGTGRLNAILDLPFPGKFLSRLRADEFVYLVNGIGLDDAGCLIQYATPGQRRMLVDMDAWDGHEFVPERFDRILDVAKEHGLDFTVAMLKDLDPGLLILSMIKRAKFHTVEEAEDMEFQPGTWFMTPDNTFVVECASEDDVVPLRNEIDLIYAISVAYAHWVIQGGRWETVSSVQEQSLEYRRGRLADTGFPEDDDVFEIYEPFDLEAMKARVTSGAECVAAGMTTGEPLAIAVSGTPDSLFFWRVLSAPGAEKLNSAYILSQTMNLVNRVMGAEVRDLSDIDAWSVASGHAVTIVSLGLEALSDGDIDVGLSVLARAVPLELFRAGIEFSRPVSILARQIVGDVGGLANLSLFGDSEAADIDAAAAFPVKCPPSISGSGGQHVDFSSCQQVRAAVAMMKKYKAVVQFAIGVLGFEPSRRTGSFESIEAPRFSSVVATAWARQILDGSLSIVPLDAGAVSRLRLLAFDGPIIKPALRIARKDTEDEYSVAVREFLNESLDKVEACLGCIEPSADIDVRLIGDCLLVIGG